MPYYYINNNPQTTGEHEIHKDDCSWLKNTKSKTFLGYFSTFSEAKKEALKHYNNVDGCAYCCPEGHRK